MKHKYYIELDTEDLHTYEHFTATEWFKELSEQITCRKCAKIDTPQCPFYTSEITNDVTDYCSFAERKWE